MNFQNPTLQETINYLESLGTEQTRKTYKRHGSGDKVFGVKFGDLKPLAKKIGPNHQLALELWDTENTDARSLALLIAEPEKLTESQADKWTKHSKYYMVSSMIAGVIARSPLGIKKYNEYTKNDGEYVKQTGYNIISELVKSDFENNTNSISNNEAKKILKTIESEIHSSPNRARHAMNNTLICIASYKPQLTDLAIETATSIGKVEVDHGDTSCKTPAAIPYIKKTIAYLEKRGKR